MQIKFQSEILEKAHTEKSFKKPMFCIVFKTVQASFDQVCSGGKRKKDEISVDCLDFNKKILHTAWHPQVGNIPLLALFVFL